MRKLHYDEPMTEKHLNVRFPADIHERIKRAAAKDHRSMNSWILITIQRALAEQEAASKRLAKAS